MSGYVPRRADVRECYAHSGDGLDFKHRLFERYAEFDRWLTQHDDEVVREAEARALEAEAENLFKIIGNQMAIFQEPAATQMISGIHLSAERLRARAAGIRERGKRSTSLP